MRLAAKIVGFVVVTAVSAVTLLPMGPSHAASGEEVIKARVDFMKDEMNGHWKPLAAYAKSGKGSLADVEENAMAIVKLAKEIPAHFPKDTGRGNYPDKMTRALPVIWTDWDGFKKDVQEMVDGSEKLARLAKEGDKDGVVALIGASGSSSKTKIGCAGCHKTFRGEKVK
ncbi:MAG: cytochrome c [Betaproteobacteria bacterium]|nr:cytochrome c [Betaproteobacteria bacterium]MDH3437586.1 cytochrome c [Betaproteobacteria bacterium]